MMRALKLLAVSSLILTPFAVQAEEQKPKEKCVIPMQYRIWNDAEGFRDQPMAVIFELSPSLEALRSSTTILSDGRNMCETLIAAGVGLQISYDYGVDGKSAYSWFMVQGYDLKSGMLGSAYSSTTAVKPGTSEEAMISAIQTAIGKMHTLRLPADVDKLIKSARGEERWQKELREKVAK
jgi:hypothetical protein